MKEFAVILGEGAIDFVRRCSISPGEKAREGGPLESGGDIGGSR